MTALISESEQLLAAAAAILTPAPKPSRPPTRPRIALEVVQSMHADYSTGLSLAAVGRRYGRCGTQVRELFLYRELPVRPGPKLRNDRDAFGNYLPLPRSTAAEIDAIIAGATKISVPESIKWEWRLWPMERRMDFINRIRARLASSDDRPNLPFSDNVEPFDYGTPRAREIEARLNEGRNSQKKRVKIKPKSQGVIWGDGLWFWSPKVGYTHWGAWTSEHGRPPLHHVIWEGIHGPIPPSHVVRFADGNPNNHSPANLHLASRNELARENQASHLVRKSRAITAILLNRHRKNENHDIHALKSRGRKARAQ